MEGWLATTAVQSPSGICDEEKLQVTEMPHYVIN